MAWDDQWLDCKEIDCCCIFAISFRYTDWLYDVTKGEVFASFFDEIKTQDTDSSAKTKYAKEKRVQNY